MTLRGRLFLASKLSAEKVMGLLPATWGHALHSALQRRLGVLSDLSSENVLREVTELERMTRTVGIEWHSRPAVLEVGTGWFGLAPMVFYLAGAKSVTTIDVHDHLRDPTFGRVMAVLEANLQDLADAMAVSPTEVMHRWRVALPRERPLHDVFRRCNIRYIAPCKLLEADLPASHFDVFYSRSVLQRIPRDELMDGLRVAQRALRDGGYGYHIIHHTDHNVRRLSDANPLQYLGWTRPAYDLIQSRRFNYQNRLRHSDFVDLFRRAGFEVDEVEIETLDPATLQSVGLAPSFRSYDKSDILTSKSWFLLRKAAS